ncbi:hypothetical protein [Gorillibacterium sp. sgz5001074]|uniref:hypothetical protein n=1 Tax=Gorillibacterium sp. sgz5001074 TaxID=3446695 RepID=UPI003F66F213
MMLWEHFDKNEWFVLTMLVAAYGAIAILPKILPRSIVIPALIWGFASSTLFDFTIGGGLMDFYRVNDSNHYELTDLLIYFMFAPYGYFFVYFFEVLQITRKTAPLYILAWTFAGLLVQVVAEWMGMTHYQRGYRLEYNVVVFLAVQSVTALVYMHVQKQLQPVRTAGRKNPARG